MVRFSVYLEVLYIYMCVFFFLMKMNLCTYLVWWIIYMTLLVLFSSRKSMTYLKIMKSSIATWTEIKEQVRT